MKLKRLLITVLFSVLVLVAGAFFVSCDKGEAGAKHTGFLEGYATKMLLTDAVVIDEYIDKSGVEEYTLTVSKDGVDAIDLSYDTTWQPDEPGVWTLTYKIVKGANKGTYTANIDVQVPRATWEMGASVLTYEFGSSIKFEDLFNDLQIYVNSYYSTYDYFVEKIQVGQSSIEIEDGVTEYEISSFDPHYVTVGVRTFDGQILKSVVQFNVCESDREAIQYFEDNGIEYHGYKTLYYDDKTDSVSVELVGGGYVEYFDKADLPYIAYRGDYGLNDFVTIDFTGNNLPKTAFFCDLITPNLYDRNNGMYVSNGTVTNNGGYKTEQDWTRLTFFGTRKMEAIHVDTGYGVIGSEGFLANPSPASRTALKNGVKYRYIIGYTDYVAPYQITENDKPVTVSNVTVNMLLINLDTNEIVMDLKRELETRGANGAPLFDDAYMAKSTNVVLYGSYGINTSWDKIYLVQHANSIYDVDTAIPFVKDAPDYAVKGEALTLSQFISSADQASCSVYYSANGKEKVPFTSSVALAEAGVYRIIVEPTDGSRRTNVRVVNVNESLTVNFEDGVIGAIEAVQHAGTYIETQNPISGSKSGKYLIGRVLKGASAIFGLSWDYLDKVFSDSSVESITVSLRSEASVTISPANGKKLSSWGSSLSLEAGKIGFLTIPRAYYENSIGNEWGIYPFLLTAKNGEIPQFSMLVDDISVSKVYDDMVYTAVQNNDLKLEFDETVSTVFIGGVNRTANVTVDGNEVTVPYSLMAEYADQKVQICAITTSRFCTLNVDVSVDFEAYALNESDYATGSYFVLPLGTIADGITIDGSNIPFENGDTEVYIKKSDLIAFAGNKVMSIKIGNEYAQVPVAINPCDVMNFENNQTNPYAITGVNIGEIEKVGSDVITAYNGDYALRVTLPDLAEDGYHEINIPIEYLEELFSMPYVESIKFNIALSFDGVADGYSGTSYENGGSGVQIGETTVKGNAIEVEYEMLAFDKGTANSFTKDGGGAVRQREIQRKDFNVYLANGEDYTIYIASAKHKGSVEYFYIDSVRLNGFYDGNKVYFDEASVSDGLVLDGFYGNVTTVKHQSTGGSALTDCEINGNSITVAKSKAISMAQGSGNAIRMFVYTDKGVTYLIDLYMGEAHDVTVTASDNGVYALELANADDVITATLNGKVINGLDGVTFTATGVEISESLLYSSYAGANVLEMVIANDNANGTTRVFYTINVVKG